jgi:hypothetical protein
LWVCRPSMSEKATKGLHDKVEKECGATHEDQTGQQHDLKYPRRTVLNQDPRISNCQRGSVRTDEGPTPRTKGQRPYQLLISSFVQPRKNFVRYRAGATPGPSQSRLPSAKRLDEGTKARRPMRYSRAVMSTKTDRADRVERLAKHIGQILQYLGQLQKGSSFVQAQGMGDDEHQENCAEVHRQFPHA